MKSFIKKLSIIVLFFTMMLNFAMIPSVVSAGSGTLTNGATFSWSEETIELDFFLEWNNETFSRMDTFSEDGEYNYTKKYLKDGYWIVEDHQVNYTGITDYSTNSTIHGNCSMSFEVNYYQVELNYKDRIQLFWFAIKNGIFEMVYYRDYYLFENWQYVETNYTDAITYSNYSDSSEDTLLETYSLETNWTDSGITDYHNPPMMDEYQNITQTVDFTAPLILMTQIYTLDNGEKIAWAELIHDMIIFNDTNNNGFYDVGLTSNGNSKLSLWSSDENIGVITPAAFQTNMVWNTDSGTNTMGQNYPSDISAEKISERIEFTPPSETSQDILSWGISYPNFTAMYSTGTPIQPPINATFDQMSPTDYSFGFEYALTDKDAELSYTQDVNKMQDSDFYSFCDGLSLSVPHYTYFISSAEIQKEYNDEMTKRQDLFQFTSNETEIAALDFADPVKMMYNLHNYSGSEEISTHESAGASVNLLATENYEQLVTPVTQGNIFANLIFGLENIVDTIPLFAKNDRLYTIATTNYPVWSGEKLVHDPVLRATYSEGGSEEPPGGDGPPTPPGAIPGVPILGLIFTVSLGTLIVLKRKHTTTK